MRTFKHVDALTVEEAVSVLVEYDGKAKVIAGGTDILGTMKDLINPEYPEALVNIKTIPDLVSIQEENAVLKIGALAKLQDIAESATVRDKYPALAEAADRVGSPPLRSMGTIGGNLCQENRCWYYRASFNQFFCFRKGGALCFAVPGDNRHNAILGGQVCFAICPSDTAVALSALDATVVTSKRNIPIGDFYKVLSTALDSDEIVTEVRVPQPQSGSRQTFLKYSARKAIDFAVVSVASIIVVDGGTVASSRIVLGGVAPVPYRATAAEDALNGKAISESVAEAAGTAAVGGAMPLSNNGYKIPIAKALVKRAILS